MTSSLSFWSLLFADAFACLAAVQRVLKAEEAWIKECEETLRPMLLECQLIAIFNSQDITYGVPGVADKPFSTRMTSPSSTTSAMFSGISSVILVFFVARSSISGDGANLDMVD